MLVNVYGLDNVANFYSHGTDVKMLFQGQWLGLVSTCPCDFLNIIDHELDCCNNLLDDSA